MKKLFSLLIISSLIIVAACNKKDDKREMEAQNKMFQAERSFEKDSFNLALTGKEKHLGFLDIIEQYDGTECAQLAYYYAGICYLNIGQYEKAISYLKNTSFSDQIISSMAIGAIGDAYMETGEDHKALEFYCKAADNSDNLFTTPFFLMRAAMTYEIIGRKDEALKLYMRIRTNYHGSYESKNVVKYIARIKAESDTEVGYLKTGKNNKNEVTQTINTKNIGVVSGTQISVANFFAKAEKAIELSKLQNGTAYIMESDSFNIYNTVWSEMVKEIVLKTEYDKLGIVVCPEELMQLIVGDEPHPFIVRAFRDQATGEFDSKSVLSFIQNLNDNNDETKKAWLSLEDAIIADRYYTKYFNLIEGGIFIPTSIAKLEYEINNTTAKVTFFAEKYSDVEDGQVSVTDNDITEYYSIHKDEFTRDNSLDIEYVVFEIIPSADEIKEERTQIEEIAAELKDMEIQQIQDYINRYSDTRADMRYHKKGDFDPVLDSIIFKGHKNEFIGPIFNENEYTYTVAKILDIGLRPDSIRANHILVSYNGALRATPELKRSKDDAKKRADSLFKIIKNDATKFGFMAQTLSDDKESGINSGVLGWFADGAMVEPFNETCSKGRIGELQMVESIFGYHIIKVTSRKNVTKKAKVAVFTREIQPSPRTVEETYKKATAFTSENNSMEKFNKAINDNKIIKYSEKGLSPMLFSFKDFDSSREIIRWAFKDSTKVGDVSSVFESNHRYIVACLTNSREKGFAEIEEIKAELKEIIRKGKRATFIINSINAMNTQGISIEQLSEKCGKQIVSLNSLSFNMNDIPGFGSEPSIIGAVFGLTAG